jgi:hypothetical protein
MRFTRLNSIRPQFNIIKRMFCHHNNISEQIHKNVNIVSKLNDIDAKLSVIDVKIKNMDSIMFSIFCLWNGLYFPVILYFSN